MKKILVWLSLFFILLSLCDQVGALVALPARKPSVTNTCVQVIQYAENKTTGECQLYSTPCDVPTGWNPVQKCTITDTKKVIEPTFEVRKFDSCSALEDTLTTIFERYQDRYWYPYGMDHEYSTVTQVPAPIASVTKNTLKSDGTVGNNAQLWSSDPFSTTNIQVAGVDEADVVKTDGMNIYTYSQQSHEVRIVRMSDMRLEKTIALPDSFSSIEMYISWSKLVLIGHKYASSGAYYLYRYYTPENKTIVAVYDIISPENPKLERYNQIDGEYRDSRLIGSTLYFLSTNTLRLPPIYMTADTKLDNGEYANIVEKLQKNFALKNVVPQIKESRMSSSTGKYLQSIRSSVASCSDITFVLPDTETMKHIDFSPSFVSLSSFDITNPAMKMKSQLLFGDVGQIHMSQKSLYIASSITQNSVETDATCPAGARCAPWNYSYESSTLIHRYALENGGLKYIYTTKIAGSPMNQYSMDEDTSGNFRLVTQKYSWSSGVNKNASKLSIINPSGKMIGSLANIAPGENFQSARFIANRLYLVTFEQIDPLFVIDLSDPTTPKVLGELKMPWYSTYLHPYDADRLIGIGYDTFTNKYGGVQNSGLKIDLYNVKDVKNPKQEGSLTLGDNGSSSEVLTNPRAFVWYKEKNLLLMPAQIQYSAHDPVDTYRVQSIYQWLIGISITPGSVSEKWRVTHIVSPADMEKKWRAECANYSGSKSQSCRKLLDGSEYCTTEYNYVPQYCFADSTVESYIAANIWNYSSDFITRALYRGDTFYSLSDSSIKSWNFMNTSSPKGTIEFSSSWTKPSSAFPTVLR